MQALLTSASTRVRPTVSDASSAITAPRRACPTHPTARAAKPAWRVSAARSELLERPGSCETERAVSTPPESSPKFVFFKGEFVPYERAKVSVLTHGLNYGTGCFEG